MCGIVNGAIPKILPFGLVLKRGRFLVVRAIKRIPCRSSRMLYRSDPFHGLSEPLFQDVYQVDNYLDDDQDNDGPFQS